MDPSWVCLAFAKCFGHRVFLEVAESFAEPAAFGDGSGSAGGLFGLGLLGVTWLAQTLVVADDVESARGQADDVVLNEFHVRP